MGGSVAKRIAARPDIATHRRGQHPPAAVENRPAQHLDLGGVGATVVTPQKPRELGVRKAEQLPIRLIAEYGDKRRREDYAKQGKRGGSALGLGGNRHRNHTDGQNGKKHRFEDLYQHRPGRAVQ